MMRPRLAKMRLRMLPLLRLGWEGGCCKYSINSKLSSMAQDLYLALPKSRLNSLLVYFCQISFQAIAHISIEGDGTRLDKVLS